MADGNEQRNRLLRRLEIDCGPFIMEALANPKVNEVLRNADGRIWLDEAGKGLYDSGHVMPTPQAESLLMTTAGMLNETLTRQSPVLEGEFPLNDNRLQALIPPIVKSPIFSLRKQASAVFPLQQYDDLGMFKPGTSRHGVASAALDDHAGMSPLQFIKHAVACRANILVVGGTGSGKTTLTNAVLGEIADACPTDRLLAIEDLSELQIRVENHVRLRSYGKKDVSDMAHLLKSAMRLRPDRIVVGEVRGGEAYALLKAWNSGHPGGLATVHADSALLGLNKLKTYMCESPDAASVSEQSIYEQIGDAVQVVLFIEKLKEAPWRAVSEICRVRGFKNGAFDLDYLTFNQPKE